MSTSLDLQIIFDLIEKTWLFLTRSVVQVQLAAMFSVVLLAWVLTKGSWSLLGRRISARIKHNFMSSRWRYFQHALSALPDVAFLLLSILFVALTSSYLISIGKFAGLLNDFIVLLSAMLAYRVLIAILYTAFGHEAIRHYNYRLLAPALALFLASQVLKNNLIDLNLLADIQPFSIFDSEIRIGALFFATVGLYFWINIVWAIQDVLIYLFTDADESEMSALEASLTIFRYFMIMLGILLSLNLLGLNNTTIAAITGGLSVGVGFGLREILGNFISGLLLLFERSLHPGDVIKIGSEMGIVEKLSIRSTTLRTNNNIEIIVPNQKFLTSEVTTYTKSSRLARILVPVGASYDSDPEEVRRVLLALAKTHPEVEKDPPPTVFFTQLGDSSIDFQLAVWLHDPKRIKAITSDLYFMIFKEFGKHQIEIPYPQQELHVRNNTSWEELSALLNKA